MRLSLNSLVMTAGSKSFYLTISHSTTSYHITHPQILHQNSICNKKPFISPNTKSRFPWPSEDRELKICCLSGESFMLGLYTNINHNIVGHRTWLLRLTRRIYCDLQRFLLFNNKGTDCCVFSRDDREWFPMCGAPSQDTSTSAQHHTTYIIPPILQYLLFATKAPSFSNGTRDLNVTSSDEKKAGPWCSSEWDASFVL